MSQSYNQNRLLTHDLSIRTQVFIVCLWFDAPFLDLGGVVAIGGFPPQWSHRPSSR